MTELVIGMGQIGKAVQEAICFDKADTLDLKTRARLKKYDILHICIPYSDRFKSEVKKYIKRFQPEHVIVYSTVPVGTCSDIDDRIVHSPVEGKLPDLAPPKEARSRPGLQEPPSRIAPSFGPQVKARAQL